MKYFLLIFLLSIAIMSAETIELNLNIKNDLNQSMPLNSSFGISTSATDNLDPALGETLLPPIPIQGFYAAFEFIDSSTANPDGSKYYDRVWTNKDLRHYPDTVESYYVRHKMIFRFGNGSKIMMNWNSDFISDKIDSIFIRDAFNGIAINVDMKKNESLEWSNDGIEILYIHVYYNLKKVSVQEDMISDLEVFPNPASDIINISNADNIEYAELFDVFGNKVLSSQNSNVLYSGSLRSGVYFLKVFDNKRLHIKKIIINR